MGPSRGTGGEACPLGAAGTPAGSVADQETAAAIAETTSVANKEWDVLFIEVGAFELRGEDVVQSGERYSIGMNPQGFGMEPEWRFSTLLGPAIFRVF
jgi:hypothetical protein